MAIVHLGAKRLQGTKIDRVVDSLGSSAEGTNSGITLSDGYIKQSLGSHTGYNGGNFYRTSYRALGSTLNTNWVFRFRYKPTALNSNSGSRDGDGMGVFIMDGQYKDNVNDAQVDSRKAIGYAFRSRDSNSTWKYSGYQGTSTSSDSGVMHHTAGHTEFTDQATVDEEYYIEIIKNGTTVTVTQRVGSHSASATETETLSSSLSGFTHINIVSFDGNGSTQPVVEAEIRDIELWDNATSASGTATWSGISDFTHQTGTTGHDYKLGSGAYSFDGSGDQVIFGSASDWAFLNSGEDFSLAFWCKPTATNANQQLFATMNDSSGANKGFAVSMTSANKMNIAVYPSAGGGYPFASDEGTSVFEAGVWHHYALVYTKSDGNMNIYKDGSVIITQAKGGTFTSGTPQFALMFGQRGDGGDRDYNGELDDVGVYSRALTATEVGKLANSNVSAKKGFDSDDTAKNDIANGKFSFEMKRDGSHDGVHWDLSDDTPHSDNQTSSGVVSGTQWVLRAKMKFSAISGGSGNGNYMWLGLSKNYNSFTSNDNDDAIYCQFHMDNTNYYRSNDLDGSSAGALQGTGDNSQSWTPATDGTYYYVDIRRTDSDAYSVSVYTGDVFSTGNVGTMTGTCNANVADLRYIKILNFYNSGGGRKITGEIARFKIYNGTNSRII